MNKKIILFGCGVYGLKAFQYLGKDNVYAFCDNECKAIGVKYGIEYITVNKLREIFNEYILIIAMNQSNAQNVVRQLMMLKIDDFIVLDSDVLSLMNNMDVDNFLQLINDNSKRYRIEKQQLFDMMEDIKEQLDLLKSVSDIRLLKTPQGYLKYVQEDTINIAKKLFNDIEKLQIHPFLIAGSLLGYFRHGGFIPWDDDMDFGLFRKEYSKLMEYGKQNYLFLEIKTVSDQTDDENLKQIFLQNPGKFIMIVSPSCMQIAYGSSEIVARKIDFFAYDFFDEDYSFEQYKQIISKCAEERYIKRGNEFICNVIKKEAKICNESTKVYFGLDNMDSYLYHRKDWIMASMIMPLRKIQFLGLTCYVPNKIEDMLHVFFEDYMSYPDTLTDKHLQEIVATRIISHYLYIGIEIDDVDKIKSHIHMYNLLREHGYYCVFILMSGQYHNYEYENLVKNELRFYRVEYISREDSKLDYIITDRTNVGKKKIDINLLKNISDEQLLIYFSELDKMGYEGKPCEK